MNLKAKSNIAGNLGGNSLVERFVSTGVEIVSGSLTDMPSLQLAAGSTVFVEKSLASPSASGNGKRRSSTIELGQLPVELINRTLDLDLEPGPLVFTGGAQAHVQNRHADDISTVLAHLASVGIAPLYVGDDHKNPGKIELVSRVAADQADKALLLVAVTIERDQLGRYRVASCYRISEQKVQKRREKGFLRVAKYT